MVYGFSVEDSRVFLRVGDRVYQCYREEWGLGAVVEEMTSTIVGGTCLVRILFEDGVQRTFNNDLNSESCCYFMGMRREYRVGSSRRRTGARRIVQRSAAGNGR